MSNIICVLGGSYKKYTKILYMDLQQDSVCYGFVVVFIFGIVIQICIVATNNYLIWHNIEYSEQIILILLILYMLAVGCAFYCKRS